MMRLHGNLQADREQQTGSQHSVDCSFKWIRFMQRQNTRAQILIRASRTQKYLYQLHQTLCNVIDEAKAVFFTKSLS